MTPAMAADSDDIGKDPKPLNVVTGTVSKYLGRAISLAVLVAVVLQLRHVDFRYVWSIVPTSPVFWTFFAALYLHGPLADWLIFRRVWRIPLAGIVPLVRKQIGNTLLLGYIGEVYFYDWARKRADIKGSPFGAVKDVAILSAVLGNIMTLLAVALAWPLLMQQQMGIRPDLVLASVAFIIGSTLAILLFRRRLFSLPTAELRYAMVIHGLRILIGWALVGICWHLVLPEVELSWWVVLSVVSMLIGRLPFVTNKDFVFAGLAVFLIGRDSDIPALMTMMASLMLVAHLSLGAVLMVPDLFSSERRK